MLVSCWMAERKFLSLLRYKEEITVSGQYQGSVQNRFYDTAVFLQRFNKMLCVVQGPYGSLKSWKVMEFMNFVYQAWKVTECNFCHRKSCYV